MLCQYKDVLGIPKKGIHSYRLFNIAIVDVLLTFILAYFIYFFTKFNYWIILISLFIIAIFLHRLFCVNSTINLLLFGTV